MLYTQKMAYTEQPVQLGSEMPDGTEAAPLTTERRYGFYAIGCGAAAILIVIATGIGAILVTGVRDAGIMLAILLPILVLAAVSANIFLWYQHKRATRRREIAANEWVSTTYAGQTAEASARQDTPRNSDSWFRRFSQRTSTQSTPPPGYQTVVGTS